MRLSHLGSPRGRSGNPPSESILSPPTQVSLPTVYVRPLSLVSQTTCVKAYFDNVFSLMLRRCVTGCSRKPRTGAGKGPLAVW